MNALQKTIADAMQSALQPILVRIDALEQPKPKSPKTPPKSPANTPVVAVKAKKQRQSTPKETNDLRNLVRDTLMQLIDAELLAPQYETELYANKLYLGKKIGQYTLNKSFFLVILNYVFSLHGVDQTPENTRILQRVVNKRRQYHQASWKHENKPCPLKYGGDLGVMNAELRKLYKNQSLSVNKKQAKTTKSKKRNHKSTPKKGTSTSNKG